MKKDFQTGDIVQLNNYLFKVLKPFPIEYAAENYAQGYDDILDIKGYTNSYFADYLIENGLVERVPVHVVTAKFDNRTASVTNKYVEIVE